MGSACRRSTNVIRLSKSISKHSLRSFLHCAECVFLAPSGSAKFIAFWCKKNRRATTNAAQQRVLADKNEKIDSLSTKLEKKSRIQPPKPDEEVKKLRAEVTALAVEAESAIAVRLSSAFETLCAYCAENMIDTPRDFMAGLVCQLESTARSLRSTFDLPDEPTGNAAPSWLTDPTPQINGQEA